MIDWILKRLDTVERNLNDFRARIETPVVTSFTPVWTSASNPQPAIGSGTLEGAYMRRGPMCLYWFSLLSAADTTFGSGAWSFSLPIAPFATPTSRRYIGMAYFFDSTPGQRHIEYCAITPGNTVLTSFFADHETTTTITGTSPINWGTGDNMHVQIEYRVA